MNEYDYAGKTIINNTNYYIIRIIGNGASSDVFLVYNSNNEEYALKIYTDDLAYETEILDLKLLDSHSESFLKLYSYGQIEVEKGLSQNNIILNKYIGKINKYALLNYIPNGELSNYVTKLNKGFSEEISRIIFITVLSALSICHKNGIIHGDMKLENILVDENFDVKLIDFGYSKKISDGKIFGYCGTTPYSSPETLEVCNKRGYDGIKNDIFCMGILLLALLLGRMPFEKCSFSDPLYRLIIIQDYDSFWKNIRTKFISDELKDLIMHMICFNPNERISLNEIISHPWIDNKIDIFKVKNFEYIQQFKMRKAELDKSYESDSDELNF